jgi:hypothetical protein
MSAYGYTAGYGFTLINYQTQAWQTEEYQNWRLLDGLLSNMSTSPVPFAVSTGSGGNYVVSYTPALTSYTSGQIISFAANHVNAGAVTVNVNGLGAKAMIRDGEALSGGEFSVSDFVRAIYDGTQFLILNPTADTDFTIADGSVTPAKMSTGHPNWDVSGNSTVGGTFTADGAIKTGAGAAAALVISHNDTALTSGKVFYSTSDPTGGSNGDMWFKYTA